MPAEGEQVLGAALDGAEQIEARDAAPGALGLVVALAEEDGRAIEALGDARRDDAYDALVPGRRRQDERRRRRVGDHSATAAEDGGLDGLTLLVELVEAQRHGQRRLAIGAAQQFERQRRILEAAGGVEPRRQAKADGAGVEPPGRRPRPPGGPPARGAANCAAGPARWGEHAVLVDERHYVGDGADGDHVAERPQGQRHLDGASPGFFEEGVRKLEGDPDPGKLRARVAGQFRGDDDAVGRRALHLVMIGDDDVHAELAGRAPLRRAR